MKPSIIMCRFDPSGYELPRKHFLDSVAKLSCLGVELIVVQAMLPGQVAEQLPKSVKSIELQVSTVMFRKENLWNYGAKRASGDALIFLDADVFFKDESWLEGTVNALGECDVLQPFTECVWLDIEGKTQKRREPIGNALSQGIAPNLNFYHPGFGWAMTRVAFDRIGGFYDRCVSGSGDVAFTFGMMPDKLLEPMLAWWRQNDRFYTAPSYQEWRRRTLELGLVVGRHPGAEVEHRWHGTIGGRLYAERDSMFPRGPDLEYRLARNGDGIIEWMNFDGDAACREYFDGRLEDGTPPWLFGIGTAKSGTNSLIDALRIINVDARHCGSDVAVGYTEVVNKIEDNRASGRKLFDGISDIDALADWPIHELYKDIAEQYPAAKFVLTYRPPHDVALSWVRMIFYRGQKSQGADPSWPEYTRTYSGFREYAERHVSEVLEYFSSSPERLMILDCRDSDESIWRRLCDFTSRPRRVVAAKYPRSFSHEESRA